MSKETQTTEQAQTPEPQAPAYTADHLQVLANVINRAPHSLAESMVIQQLFIALEAQLQTAAQDGPEAPEQAPEGDGNPS